jgi:hypothetical protein
MHVFQREKREADQSQDYGDRQPGVGRGRVGHVFRPSARPMQLRCHASQAGETFIRHNRLRPGVFRRSGARSRLSHRIGGPAPESRHMPGSDSETVRRTDAGFARPSVARRRWSASDGSVALIWKILHQRVRHEERGPAVSAEAKKVRAEARRAGLLGLLSARCYASALADEARGIPRLQARETQYRAELSGELLVW